MVKNLAPIKQRVLQLIDYKRVAKGKFLSELGISSSNFRGQNLYSEIGGDVIVKILTMFPDLNSEWLLLGTGNITKETTVITFVEDDYKSKYYELLEKYTLALEEIKELGNKRTKSVTITPKPVHK